MHMLVCNAMFVMYGRLHVMGGWVGVFSVLSAWVDDTCLCVNWSVGCVCTLYPSPCSTVHMDVGEGLNLMYTEHSEK